MAIRGQMYIKTAWAFQERPVASAKLNLWDDRIAMRAALTELLRVAGPAMPYLPTAKEKRAGS